MRILAGGAAPLLVGALAACLAACTRGSLLPKPTTTPLHRGSPASAAFSPHAPVLSWLSAGASGRGTCSRAPSPLLSRLGRKGGARGARMCAVSEMEEAERVALWDKIEGLELEMRVAAEGQKFEEAAKLRDKLRSLKLKDPYISAEANLAKAVEEERYEDAAALTKALKEIGKPPTTAARAEKRIDMDATGGGLGVGAEAPFSDTTTAGIRVKVSTYYMEEQSAPADGRFLFGYNVTISNVGRQACQLVSRNWLIRAAASSKVEEVSGSGVVGRQPVLEKGEEFSYTSACPLSLPRAFLEHLPPSRVLGSMEGSYTMVAGALGQDVFQVKIAPFSFVLPKDVDLAL
mmetsp:Transcript_51212/g.124790  ORF Transcript_51212/g.124790 Transcript_51212/m.124790 type:complete len:347 (+) Transcript_51212:80-1120(+)